MSENQDKRSPGEELLEELLATDLPAEEILARWQETPHGEDETLTAELMDLISMRTELERDAKEVRDVIDEAAQLGEAPGAGLVGSFFEEKLAGGAGAGSPWAGRLRAVAALSAAAAALLFVLWWRDGTGGADNVGEGTRLGGEDAVELLAPKGPVEAFESFRWSRPARIDGWYELVVRDEQGNEVERVTDLSGTSWTPPRGHAPWPSRIEWELSAHDTDGRTGSWSASAWRE